MKKTLLVVNILIVANCFALPLPKIYLPFEETDGFFDKHDPAWINRAPGAYDGQLWLAERGRLAANSNAPGQMPKIAVGQGVAGGDCMDLTATNSDKQLGTLHYGALPNTADAWFANTPAEAAFDNAMSVTLMGWFNTADEDNAIGFGDQLNARMLNKYGQFQVLMNQGRFGVYVNGSGSWAYSPWGSYNQPVHKGKWVFFAITYDGTIEAGNNVKFYVGTPESPTVVIGEGSTGTSRGKLTNNPGQYLIVGNFGIGFVHGNASFNGLLDNLRVFSSYDDNSGALALNNIELYRQIDLGITEMDESQIYLSGDINRDYRVDIDDLTLLAAEWLDDTLPVMPPPIVHLTFDDAGSAPIDENNPAFANRGTAGYGEIPSLIGRLPETHPDYSQYPDGITLSISENGIRGGALDLTARPMNSLASMLVYGNTDPNGTDTALQQALDWPLSLTFTCWWKHDQEEPLNVPAFLLRRVGQLSFWANARTEPSYGLFGEIGFVPNDDDSNSGNMIYSPWMYPETDEWIFFAFTLDMLLDQTDPAVGRIKWYRGTINQPVTLHTQVRFPLDEILAPETGSPLVIGNYSHLNEEADANFSALIDEMRLYVSKIDSSAALTAAQLEAIRQNDAEDYLTKQADVDKDGSVDLADFAMMAAQWLESRTPYEMLPFDPSIAAIYLPFENDNGIYGFGSTSNPAWVNAANGEAPGYIGNDVPPTWPTITTSGIKGDAFYASDPTKTGEKTMTISWTGTTTNAFSQAQSYTVTGWVNTRDVTQNGSESYILRAFDGGIFIKWRQDGRFQIMDTVDNAWRYSNWGEGYSNGNWIFFAITRDNNSIRFYFGDEATPVSAGHAITGLSLSNTADCTRVVLGGLTYNGTDVYVNADLDEIRVFSSKTDNSGALTIEELEDIRRVDLGL